MAGGECDYWNEWIICCRPAYKHTVFTFYLQWPHLDLTVVCIHLVPRLHSHHTLQVVFSGSNMKRRVPMYVNSVKVTLGLQQSQGDVITSRKGCPVQAHILLLDREQIGGKQWCIQKGNNMLGSTLNAYTQSFHDFDNQSYQHPWNHLKKDFCTHPYFHHD